MSVLLLTTLVLLVLPLFLLFFFGTNAGVMFLAACAGIVLLSSLDPAVVTTAGAVVPGEGEAYIRLSVVMLAIVLGAMMFRHTVKGPVLLAHVFVILFLAGTLWTLLPNVTGVSWLVESTNQSVWDTLSDFTSLIVSAGFVSGLVAVLARSKKH